MDETRESDTRDVPGGAPDAIKLPNRFAGVGEVVGEEAASVFSIKDASEAPFVTVQSTNVADIDDEEVSRLGEDAVFVFDGKGAGEVVGLGEVDVLHVFGGVIVLDLTASPLTAFHPVCLFGGKKEEFSLLESGDGICQLM